MPVLFEIINMAYFTLPFPCESVGAFYRRSITPQPLFMAIEKKRRSQRFLQVNAF